MRGSFLLATLLAAALASPARADDTAQREADMFGSSTDSQSTDQKATPPTTTKQDSTSAREEEMFGGDDSSKATTPGATDQTPPPKADSAAAALAPIDEKELISEAAAKNDKLQIGGRLFNQDQLSWQEKGSIRDSKLSLPTLLDVYFDGRPNGDLRVFANGRIIYDPTVASSSSVFAGYGATQPLSVALDQLWLNWNAYHKVYFTLGRQRVKWGSGVFWNPTDFLNPQKLNALALVDTRLGTTLLKVEVPVESLGWNFYAIADLSNATNLDTTGTAFRGEFVIGPAELALSAAFRKAAAPEQLTIPSYVPANAVSALGIDRALADAQPTPHSDVTTQTQLGADISAGVGPFDVHGEVAVSHGLKQLVFDAPFSFDQSTFSFTAPTAHYVDDQWVPQAVVGADVAIKYSDEDSVDLAAEYFYNGLGYSDPKLYPTLIAEGNYTPFYLGRHYAAVSLALPNPGSWNDTSFTLSTLANLSDRSFLTRLDYSVLVLTNLTIRAFANYHWGDYGELKFSVAGATSGLPTGTATTSLSGADIWDVGVGFIVSI